MIPRSVGTATRARPSLVLTDQNNLLTDLSHLWSKLKEADAISLCRSYFYGPNSPQAANRAYHPGPIGPGVRRAPFPSAYCGQSIVRVLSPAIGQSDLPCKRSPIVPL